MNKDVANWAYQTIEVEDLDENAWNRARKIFRSSKKALQLKEDWDWKKVTSIESDDAVGWTGISTKPISW